MEMELNIFLKTTKIYTMHHLINIHFIQVLDLRMRRGVGNIFNCPLTAGCDSKTFRSLFENKIINKINNNLI